MIIMMFLHPLFISLGSVNFKEIKQLETVYNVWDEFDWRNIWIIYITGSDSSNLLTNCYTSTAAKSASYNKNIESLKLGVADWKDADDWQCAAPADEFFSMIFCEYLISFINSVDCCAKKIVK